jgi:hypothetical protein
LWGHCQIWFQRLLASWQRRVMMPVAPGTAQRMPAYLITGAAGHWIAQRRDDSRTLTASGPGDLRELMIEDYETRPVPRKAAPGAES